MDWKNRDEVNAYHREYRARNRERVRAVEQESREKVPVEVRRERHRVDNARWLAKAKARGYRQKRTEEYLAKQRERVRLWKQRNPERVKAQWKADAERRKQKKQQLATREESNDRTND